MAVLLLLLLTAPLWLSWLGRYLVRAEAPCHADAVVVLAGDGFGNRILKGAQLVREGYAPRAIISGPDGMYGMHECDAAIPYAVGHGFPAQWFDCVPHEARSTREELQVLLPALQRRGVTRFVLVTSDYHTHRSRALLERLHAPLPYCVVAAPDRYYRADSWWQSREGRKIFLYEWLKTVTSWAGM